MESISRKPQILAVTIASMSGLLEIYPMSFNMELKVKLKPREESQGLS